tara:strand:+ start:3994 stop:6117 length:2124 start_codon:yes stop_codon:yes gene_type:complete
MISGKTRLIFLISGSLLSSPFFAYGHQDNIYTPAATGFLGLNTVPSARMSQTGTIQIGASTLDPFVHGFIGVQIADPLSITFRQTAETSNILKKANRLLPGVDFKLRILKESAHRPALAIGVQSALGHKRMAGEYLALTKRYQDFDFTAGVGWGRFGTSAQFDNPLKIFGKHFSQTRDLSSETPNLPSDWFSGDKVGFFGGVEYFLPYNGLSLKLDYGSDRYTAESSQSGFDAPAPWGIGLSYNHNQWLSAGVGMQGTERVMGRISIQTNPSQWPLRHKSYQAPELLPARPNTTDIDGMYITAQDNDIALTGITVDKQHLYAELDIPEHSPAPQYIGRAARHITAHSANDINEITLILKEKGLRGSSVTLLREDIDNAFRNKNRSPNEIWNNAQINAQNITIPAPAETEPTASKPDAEEPDTRKSVKASITLENQLSLSEEDTGILYRSSALATVETSPFLGFHSTITLRANLADNLHKLDKIRAPALLPVRSDVSAFSNRFFGVDRAYLGYTHSITPELHTALSAGYLEEFYAGFGGEILYRPISSRFAIGAELWQAFRRDPHTSLNTGLNGLQVTSGQAHLWYDIPRQDITAKLSAGRFLAGDTGVSFGLEKQFLNGATLNGEVAISNASDPDPFGGTIHAYHRLSLTLPIGSTLYIPEGSIITTKIAPFGRDIAQTIDKPIDLYTLSDHFTLNHMARHWQDILD